MNNKCPECDKNDQVLKVSSVFENGIHFTKTSGPMFGVGLNSDGKIGLGVGDGSRDGLSVSGLSVKLSPPEKPKKSGCLLFIGYSLLISGMIFIPSMENGMSFVVITLILLGLGILILFSIYKQFNKQMKIYNSLVEEWSNLFYCQRDDIVFDNQTGFKINASELQSYYKKSINNE